MSAWGTSTLVGLRPKSRAESSIGHSDIGGLSTVIEFAPSEEPNKNAFHETVPACTAAV
jgi:hypothetical protein